MPNFQFVPALSLEMNLDFPYTCLGGQHWNEGDPSGNIAPLKDWDVSKLSRADVKLYEKRSVICFAINEAGGLADFEDLNPVEVRKRQNDLLKVVRASLCASVSKN